MAKLTVISGVGGKLPAAFLLEMDGKRILLDLGEGPQPGVKPDVSGIGAVDAICLSHAHIDHVGSLELSDQLGNPPIYATAQTFRQIAETLVSPDRRIELPIRGQCRIAGLSATVGRNGHAPGGVWFQFAGHGGFLYMGDWSVESLLLPFDQPPSAACIVTDASYGDLEDALSHQVNAIASFAATGAVLCTPAGGRGPEMALALSGLGLKVSVCPVVRREMELLTKTGRDIIHPDKCAEIETLLGKMRQGDDWSPTEVIVATEANAESGLAAQLLQRRHEGFRFLFSGHVPVRTPAWDMLQRNEARWLPWNVHPRLQDTMDLVTRAGAGKVVAAFAGPNDMTRLAQWLGTRLCSERVVTLSAIQDDPLKAAE